ncbi:MAG TPA: TIGR02996 domain-containing protein [Gemmataceae bacterium]|nr:TIGR02996 domain-containing protein [Gemmataceae bacterium]
MEKIVLDDTGRALIRAVAAAPLDDAPRLIFDDWLDERDREAEAFWARLLRKQIEVAAYKRENESHLPTDPDAVTAEDVARVVPWDVVAELGLERRDTRFIDCLPGWPGRGGRTVVDRCEFSPVEGVDLTTDLVYFHDERGRSSVFWRGFPVEIWCDLEYQWYTWQNLRPFHAAVPTFVVHCYCHVPYDEPRSHEVFDFSTGRFEDRRVTSGWMSRAADALNPLVLFWQPGMSVAPTKPCASPWPWSWPGAREVPRFDRALGCRAE